MAELVEAVESGNKCKVEELLQQLVGSTTLAVPSNNASFLVSHQAAAAAVAAVQTFTY